MNIEFFKTITIIVLAVVILVGGILLVNQNKQVVDLRMRIENFAKTDRAVTENIDYQGQLPTNVEGPLDFYSSHSESLDEWRPWFSGFGVGYKLQTGAITKEEALLLLPGAGSHPSLGEMERGYFAGITIACTEGYISERCDDAIQHSKECGLWRSPKVREAQE